MPDAGWGPAGEGDGEAPRDGPAAADAAPRRLGADGAGGDAADAAPRRRQRGRGARRGAPAAGGEDLEDGELRGEGGAEGEDGEEGEGAGEDDGGVRRERRPPPPKEPYEVPTSGAFWMHDDRQGGEDGGHEELCAPRGARGPVLQGRRA